jgi:hypothetical protein
MSSDEVLTTIYIVDEALKYFEGATETRVELGRRSYWVSDEDQ